jgi:hypothetical protein
VARKARRQRVLLLVLINALVLGVALVASVDLRRLRTPGGTALRWVEAAVFGNCDDYLEFSLPDADAPDPRSGGDLCRDLRASTKDARNHSATIGMRLEAVTEKGQDAEVQIRLTRQDRPSSVTLHLIRRNGRWRVLRDAETCASIGCA